MTTRNYLNEIDGQYIVNRVKALFATKGELGALQDEVDGIVAEGGEPNVIETVKVNGSALTPDANKAVDVTVPTATSDLTNDGDGQSNFATEEYVEANGGKIDVIQVNGTAQTITNKTVNVPVPTEVSDLTNDSGFQTASDVSGSISTALANSGDAYQTASDVASAISTAVSSAYRYKGSVATYSALPASGNTAGDVWDVQADGMNYAWTGSAWDALGQYVDTSLYVLASELVPVTTAEIDSWFA